MAVIIRTYSVSWACVAYLVCSINTCSCVPIFVKHVSFGQSWRVCDKKELWVISVPSLPPSASVGSMEWEKHANFNQKIQMEETTFMAKCKWEVSIKTDLKEIDTRKNSIKMDLVETDRKITTLFISLWIKSLWSLVKQNNEALESWTTISLSKILLYEVR